MNGQTVADERAIVKPMNVERLYQQLSKTYGYQHWWPITTVRGERRPSPRPMTSLAAFEICVGAILTQNTAWTNVVKALANLKRARVLTPHSISNLSINSLSHLIRPSGFFRQKAHRLMIFSRWLLKQGGSFVSCAKRAPPKKARTDLLALHGIGPETADSMLLYAGGRPTFVIDAYTKSFCAHYGVHFRSYDDYQKYFMDRLPRSVKLFQEYHALIVAWGKERRNR